MMRLVLIVVIAILLASCGDWTQMDCKEATIKTAVITWVRTPDPASICGAMGATTLERGGACTVVTRIGDMSYATVYANDPSTVDDTILGHEVKHAFGCRHA